MRLGMTATVARRLDETEAAAMVVPVTALAQESGNPIVFVVDPVAKSVRKTPVEIARVTSDGVQVSGGLQSGDMVVTAGVQFLRDGMRVRLPGEGPLARTDNRT
jgi:multidrug efflux pump subunit AcrA (membrane-fusion protein)